MTQFALVVILYLSLCLVILVRWALYRGTFTWLCVWWDVRIVLGCQLAADRLLESLIYEVAFSHAKWQSQDRPLGVWPALMMRWRHQLKPQTKSQQRQWCWASGHMFRGMMLKCPISDWSIRSGRETSVLVCGTGKEEGIWSEMAWNKERGLKVCSFRTIPGTRIPVPRDLPLIYGWDFLKAWECSVSNNSTHLLLFSCSDSFKEQYFPFFIYRPLWDTQLFLGCVVDWNPLPLFPTALSLSLRGIRDVYGTGWTWQGATLLIQHKLMPFNSIIIFWPQRTQGELTLKPI